jgi:hypothetical protein
MKKPHNPPPQGQKPITFHLIWMMYGRKKNTKRGRGGYASCEMSGRANPKLEKLWKEGYV